MTAFPTLERDRPAPAWSRAWVIVALVALLPVGATLAIDASGTTLLIGTVCSGLALAIAALVWAVRRSRTLRRDFEARLAEWAAERAIGEERLRIARDLHDLTSHGLGVITVRAASSAYLTGADVDVSRRRALLDIERVARETTSELRRMLTVLRTPGEEPAPLRPLDDLTALPGILSAATRNGLLITTDHQYLDDVPSIDAGVQLAVCTVVREALANVLRHAGPTTVRIDICPQRGALTIEVSDDGPAPGWRREPGAGHGLIGLRERLAAHDGHLEAAPTDHGFRLRATIPTETTA